MNNWALEVRYWNPVTQILKIDGGKKCSTKLGERPSSSSESWELKYLRELHHQIFMPWIDFVYLRSPNRRVGMSVRDDAM
jgi:hypothetical protein